METEVSLVTKLEAGRLGFESWQTEKEISPPKSPDCLRSPDSLIFKGDGAFIQREKQLGLEVYRLVPSSAEVKKEGCCSYSPLYNFMS
jgi:hypothetical protein